LRAHGRDAPVRPASAYRLRRQRHQGPGPARGDVAQPGPPVVHDRHQPADSRLRDALPKRVPGNVRRWRRLLLRARRHDDLLRLGREPSVGYHDRRPGRDAGVRDQAAQRAVRRLGVLAGERGHAACDLPRGAHFQRARAAARPAFPAAPQASRGTGMSSLETAVRDLRRSALFSAGVGHLHRAALAATLWILAVVIVGRFVPVEQTLRIAAFGVPLVLAAVAVAWMVARPSALSLLRTADLRLGLKERLSTAWERRSAHGPLDEALRRDALDA